MYNNIEEIAKNILNVETLETSNSDGKDFHDISVWSLKEALQSAYELGAKEALLKKEKKKKNTIKN